MPHPQRPGPSMLKDGSYGFWPRREPREAWTAGRFPALRRLPCWAARSAMPVPCESPAERIVEALANVPAALAAGPAHGAARPRSAGGGQLPPASGIAERLTERLDELFFFPLPCRGVDGTPPIRLGHACLHRHRTRRGGGKSAARLRQPQRSPASPGHRHEFLRKRLAQRVSEALTIPPLP